MKSPNLLQKGAFFGLLAAALILVLTVMAISAVDQQPQPHLRVHDLRVAETPLHAPHDRAS